MLPALNSAGVFLSFSAINGSLPTENLLWWL
jgi:hypothetical protein